MFKAADLQMLKNENKKNNGKYWSVEKSIITDPLNSVDKIVGKTSFFFA